MDAGDDRGSSSVPAAAAAAAAATTGIIQGSRWARQLHLDPGAGSERTSAVSSPLPLQHRQQQIHSPTASARRLQQQQQQQAAAALRHDRAASVAGGGGGGSVLSGTSSAGSGLSMSSSSQLWRDPLSAAGSVVGQVLQEAERERRGPGPSTAAAAAVTVHLAASAAAVTSGAGSRRRQLATLSASLAAAPLGVDDNGAGWGGSRGGGGEGRMAGGPLLEPTLSAAGAAALAASAAAPTARRRIARVPFKVLDAPGLADDFYLNLLDWSAQNVLAVGLGPDLYLWSGASAAVDKLASYTAESATLSSVGWALRGQHLAVGLSTGRVEVWDASTKTRLRAFRGHAARATACAWAGPVLATCSKDCTIHMRDMRAPSAGEGDAPQVSWRGHSHEVCGLRWSLDWASLASGGNDNKLCVWSTAFMRGVGATAAGLGARAQAAAAAGASATPLWRFRDHEAAVKGLAWSPHTDGLLASGGGTHDRKIRLYNTATGEMNGFVDTGAQVTQLVWSPHVPELAGALGYSANAVVVWRYPSMAKLATLTGHTQRVLYMALAPDGQCVVTGAGDETLRFWSVFAGHSDRAALAAEGGCGIATAPPSSLAGTGGAGGSAAAAAAAAGSGTGWRTAGEAAAADADTEDSRVAVLEALVQPLPQHGHHARGPGLAAAAAPPSAAAAAAAAFSASLAAGRSPLLPPGFSSPPALPSGSPHGGRPGQQWHRGPFASPRGVLAGGGFGGSDGEPRWDALSGGGLMGLGTMDIR